MSFMEATCRTQYALRNSLLYGRLTFPLLNILQHFVFVTSPGHVAGPSRHSDSPTVASLTLTPHPTQLYPGAPRATSYFTTISSHRKWGTAGALYSAATSLVDSAFVSVLNDLISRKLISIVKIVTLYFRHLQLARGLYRGLTPGWCSNHLP